MCATATCRAWTAGCAPRALRSTSRSLTAWLCVGRPTGETSPLAFADCGNVGQHAVRVLAPPSSHPAPTGPHREEAESHCPQVGAAACRTRRHCWRFRPAPSTRRVSTDRRTRDSVWTCAFVLPATGGPGCMVRVLGSRLSSRHGVARKKRRRLMGNACPGAVKKMRKMMNKENKGSEQSNKEKKEVQEEQEVQEEEEEEGKAGEGEEEEGEELG